MAKPIIALTMGDPAGIGPEICLKALGNNILTKSVDIVLIGSLIAFDKIKDLIPGYNFHIVKDLSQCLFEDKIINLINVDEDNYDLELGKVSKTGGLLAYKSIEKATSLAMLGEVEAIVTAPICKASLHEAGLKYLDHTEIFENLTKTKNLITMFSVKNLKIFFHTKHYSLKEACNYIKKDLLIETIASSLGCLHALGIPNPRLAVAAQNPHSGENGMFGNEEIFEIEPAVEHFTNFENGKVLGPFPADSVFHQCLMGKFHGVVSLYHDQGHIAAKMVDFEKTISVTFGMPFLRVSVDHGTAFDIAGKGIASAVSLIESIEFAKSFAVKYQQESDKLI